MPKYECWLCGRKHEIKHTPNERVFCDDCIKQHRATHKTIVSEYAKLKIEIMYETALRIIEKAGVHMHKYKEPAEIVLNKMQNQKYALFSSHEIIVAIILEKDELEYEANYSVGKYKVDFFLPEYLSCVEVDGHLHKGREIYDSNRDIDIRNELGGMWEVVRIPTKYIEKNPPAIVSAIKALWEEKQRLRRENHGVLPDNFSKRERKHYQELLGYKTQKVRKQ